MLTSILECILRSDLCPIIISSILLSPYTNSLLLFISSHKS